MTVKLYIMLSLLNNINSIRQILQTQWRQLLVRRNATFRCRLDLKRAFCGVVVTIAGGLGPHREMEFFTLHVEACKQITRTFN